MSCRHPDIQKFDEVRCCLSCGEAVFEYSEKLELDCVGSDTTTYTYRNLNYQLGQEIRLIVLDPGQDQEDLTCDIKHVNLLDEPAYEAVSYTWRDSQGDDSLCGRIFCRGKLMWITANCQAALRCLRRTQRKRSLWVDAICIDQQNNAEKNHQVQLMSTIYSSASQVLVYLAPTSPSNKLAIKRVLEYLKDMNDTPRQLLRKPQKHEFAEFLNLQYWRRVWILQEIGLAKLVTLVTEDAYAHWTSSAAATILAHCKASGDVPPGAMTWVPASRREELRLLDALSRSRSCSATDPRDKVFALLGLTQQRFSVTIPADYSSDCNEIYVKVACHMILDLGCMDVLKHTSNQPLVTTAAASWVPRWDECDSYEPLPIQFEPKAVEKFATSWFECPYQPPMMMKTCASSYVFEHSQAVNQSNLDFRCTICEREDKYGVWADSLSLSESVAPLLPCLRIRAHYLDCVQEILESITQPWPTDTRIALRPAFGGAAPCRDCHNHDVWSSRCNEGPSVERDQRNVYLDAVKRVCTNKMFFATEHSKGFMRDRPPPSTPVQIGDQIWALAGANVPFVLRCAGSYYFLLGECYLHRATLPFPCPCCGRDAEAWPMATNIIDIW